MKPFLLLLSGLPGSGKTFRRNQWINEDPRGRRVISYDELRLQYYGPQWKFNYKEEQIIKTQADKAAREALSSGFGIIIDNTNLTIKDRQHWRRLGEQHGAEVVEMDIDTPVRTCVERDRLRVSKERVGQAVIDRMALFHGWIDWDDAEIYFKAVTGKDFVVVDVDGTLANCEHRLGCVRGEANHTSSCATNTSSAAEAFVDGRCAYCHAAKFKKNWPAFFESCDQDPPIQPIIDLVKKLSASYYLLVVSGRPINYCGIKTEDWLLKHGLDPVHLFMRGSQDKRQDVEIKQEILDLLPRERIAYVLDDRDQVVEMWRRNGLTCLQVAEGKF